MNLFYCSRFIFCRRFILLSPTKKLQLSFVIVALTFVVVAALVFCYRFIFLLPLNRRRKYKAARKKIIKRRQSNNKVAIKNTERLCMALLGFRTNTSAFGE